MCSHTIACLDTCGKATEMKVVIGKMIEAFFFFWVQERRGHHWVSIEKHFGTQTYTAVDIAGSHRWSAHVDGSIQRDKVKGGAVYFGHVVVQIEACNVFQGAGVVSAQTVMWGRCEGRAALKLKGSNVANAQDICYALFHIVQTISSM